MPRRTELVAVQLLALAPLALSAQRSGGRGLEFHVGRWYNGNRADTYEFRTSTRLGAAFTHGFGVAVVVSDTLGHRRAFYGAGYEIQAWRGRKRFGPYALAGLAAGLSTDPTSHEVAAQWTMGGGVEWRPFSWFAAGAELRYRVEDRGLRGFWRTGNGARTGVSAALGIAIGLGGAARGRAMSGTAAPPELPPPAPPTSISGNADRKSVV